MMSGNQQYMPTPQNRLTPTNLSYLTSPFASQQQVQGNDMEVDFSNLANFSHMDFLNDSNPQMGYGNGGMNGMGNGNGQVNLGGLELGFGWGAEGEGHDFSEGGNQLDFFDGFYFGAGVQ